MTAGDRVPAGTVAGVLLAAGAGSRLGTPKALVRLDGERLVERGIRLLTEAGCRPVLAVLGAAADEVAGTAGLSGALPVVNPRWQEGIASSLRAGLAACPPSVGAAVVALVDQPLIGPTAVRRLVAAWQGGAVVAVATYAGAPRNPVLFDRGVWGEVSDAARGDAGARDWLRAHPDRVVAVPCEDTGSPYDIDTAADLAALEDR